MEFSSKVHTSKKQPATITTNCSQKRELLCILTLTINKLRNIKDVESTMYQAVIINNIMKLLKKKAKEEIQKKQESISRSNNISDTSSKINVTCTKKAAFHSPNILKARNKIDIADGSSSRKRSIDDLHESDLVSPSNIKDNTNVDVVTQEPGFLKRIKE